MEVCVGAKIRVPFKGEMIVATVTEIEPLEFPNKEKGWAVHLIADPPIERAVFGFPVRGELSAVSIEQIESVFEQQMRSGAKPKRSTPTITPEEQFD